MDRSLSLCLGSAFCSTLSLEVHGSVVVMIQFVADYFPLDESVIFHIY